MRSSGGGFGCRRWALVGGDLGGLGLAGAEHGLLGAVVQRPDSGGVVLTGRLSLAAQPWLTDHAVAGVVLFPGAGFVELALRAGDEVGCSVLEELTLSAPLVLPTLDAVQVQVVVGAADGSGRRAVSVYSAWEPARFGMGVACRGCVERDGSVEPAADLSAWPPAGAAPVDVADAYRAAGRSGYEYGPAFQGLRAMWRLGDEVFAEVAVLPEAAAVNMGGFGIHPVLVDAALHAMGLASQRAGELMRPETVLPFSWQGVCLHAAGASRARVRIAPTGCRERSRSSWQMRRACRFCRCGNWWFVRSRRQCCRRCRAPRRGGGGLLQVVWSPVTLEPNDIAADGVLVWEPGSGAGGVLGSVYAATREALGVLQSWLADEGPACWSCSPMGRRGWSANTSRIWPVRRCGDWRGRRRPSNRAGWCWSIRTAPLAPRMSPS